MCSNHLEVAGNLNEISGALIQKKKKKKNIKNKHNAINISNEHLNDNFHLRISFKSDII